jgi:hypothetical protein
MTLILNNAAIHTEYLRIYQLLASFTAKSTTAAISSTVPKRSKGAALLNLLIKSSLLPSRKVLLQLVRVRLH